MQKSLPLLIASFTCLALDACKDVRLGANGVDAGGGSGGGAGSTGGVAGTGGTDAMTACRVPSPDYGPTSSFERLPNGTPAAAQTCPAACGNSAWPSSGPPNIDIAIPYGSCTPGTAECWALAEIPCACRSTTGPVDGFNCSCEGGTWICRIFAQGTALCEPCPDGGVGNTDGANDAAPAPQGVFVPTGSMAVGREYHTATLLPNGKVLIAGGWVHGAGDDTAEVASAELYDPRTGTFTATGSMNFARESHTATLLANGLVLITGGTNYQGWPASAEVYDPGSGTFAVTGSLKFARGGHTATLLANGWVLIVGGYNGAIPGTPQPIDPDAGFFYTGTFPATAELYDPGTGIFTATGSLNAARDGHTATLLPNGLVLIAGGDDSDLSLQRLASAELYDPGAGTFTAAASMAVPRAGHTATLLPNGMVLIAGGDNGELANAELFDPRVGTFTSTGGMANSRSDHTATLLTNGTVLVAGGSGGAGDLASAELYDPETSRFVATGSMTGASTLHTATLLRNGMVLIAGGASWSASAELYQ